MHVSDEQNPTKKIQLIERILRLYKYIAPVRKTLRVLYAGSRVDAVSTDVRVERQPYNAGLKRGDGVDCSKLYRDLS